MLAGQDIGFLDALKVSGAGIAVVMLELAMLAVFVFLLSKFVRFFIKKAESRKQISNSQTAGTAAVPVPAPAVHTPGQKPGELELVETDEATAAVIMAIVSSNTDIPLNKLNFIRIRLLEE
jgi:oxaloacetate decarboxylase (Na+ extruding) subunit gamma